MNELHSLPSPSNPNVHLIVLGSRLETAQSIQGILHGSAHLVVCPENAPQEFSPRQVVYGALAALGMSNTKIGDACGVSFRKVASQLDDVFNTFRVDRRPQLSKAFLLSGYWRIERPGRSLFLSESQLPIIEKVTEGLKDSEIADQLHYTPANIHQHIVRIGHRTGWRRREPIALAAMLSGEIGNIIMPKSVTLDLSNSA